MYIIKKNGRPAGNVKYNTYEEARRVVRKFLRSLTSFRYCRQPDPLLVDNPYKITKIKDFYRLG